MINRGQTHEPTNSSLSGAWWVLVVAFLLLLSTLSLTITSGNLAQGYILDETLDVTANGAKPRTEAAMSHVRTDNAQISAHPGNDPWFGETFDYRGYVDFLDIPQNGTNTITITVSASSNAKFNGDVTPNDFRWTKLDGSPLANQPEMRIKSRWGNIPGSGSYTFEVTGLSENARANFLKQATVEDESSASPGAIADANIYALIDNRPQISLETLELSANKILNCDVVQTYKAKVTGSGGYLMDIKFADVQGLGKVVLDKGKLVNGNSQAANSLKVTAPDGTDITDRILNGDGSTNGSQGASYDPNDPSYPYYPNPLVEQNKPNIKFIDSMNWRYNPELFTGDTWIDAGTVITVKRYVKRLSCLQGFATDYDPNRGVMTTIEVAAPGVTSSESANDKFNLPGAPKVEYCEGLYWKDDKLGSGQTKLGVLVKNGDGFISKKITNWYLPSDNPDGGPGVGPNAGASTYIDALALWDKQPNRIFYWARPRNRENDHPKLAYYDLKTREFHYYPTNVSDTKFGKPYFPLALAFRQDGKLYGFTRGFSSTNRGTEMLLYSLDVANGDRQWKEVLRLDRRTFGYYIKQLEAKDMVFNEDGSIYVLMRERNIVGITDKQHYLVHITADEIRNGGTYDVGTHIKPINSPSNANIDGGWFGENQFGGGNFALGYATDGKLYMAGASGKKVLRLDPVTGNTYLVPISYKDGDKENGAPYYTSFTSCNYGGKPSPSNEPKFAVEKSAIDPVTGAVAEPGTNTENRVRLTKSGEATVSYRVTVTNTGGAPGTPSLITEKFTAPRGFTVSHIVITDQRTGKQRVIRSGGDSVTTNVRPGKLSNIRDNQRDPISQSWQVEAHIRKNPSVTDISQVKNCQIGKPGYGLFNKVTMQDDADGEANNFGCIPITNGGRLFLYKQLQDQYGIPVSGAIFQNNSANVTAIDPDRGGGRSRDFHLAGSGFEVISGQAGSGENDDSNAGGIGGTVKEGRYTLSESYKLAGTNEQDARYINYQPGQMWDCRNSAGKKVTVDKQLVDVAEDDTVRCLISNKQVVPFAIKKIVKDPAAADNAHIGKAVSVSPSKTTLLKYRIVVKSLGKITGNTGAISDYFEIPAGLVWDTEYLESGASAETKGKAKIEFDSNGSYGWIPSGSGFNDEGVKYLSENQFEEYANIAKNVRDVRPDGELFFDVSIPVKQDTSKDSTGKTKFDANEDRLRECETVISNGNKYTNDRKGVPNVTYLEREDRNHSQDYYTDNYACIPVKSAKWQIEKAAQQEVPNNTDTTWPNVNEEEHWAPAGMAGTKVFFTPDPTDSSRYKAVVNYRIKITNLAAATEPPAVHPNIIDRFIVPSHIQDDLVRIDGLANAWSTTNNQDSSKTLEVYISSDDKKIDPGKSRTYKVTLNLSVAAADLKKVNWENISKCEATAQHLDPKKGLTNMVSINKDADGESNNYACVPAEPKEPKEGVITVLKRDAASNPLPGAEFKIYPDEFVYDQQAQKSIHRPAANPIENGLIVDPTDPSKFDSAKLELEKEYWLVETKAPYVRKASREQRYNLLAKPLRFKVVKTKDGSKDLAIPYGRRGYPLCRETCTFRIDQGTFIIEANRITVHDTRAAVLPKAGSASRVWLVLVAMIMIGGGLYSVYNMTSCRKANKTERQV